MVVQLSDFSQLAKYYNSRPGYSRSVLELCFDTPRQERENVVVADIGAGTGKLTQELSNLGFRGYAVEPNEAMYQLGRESCENFKWSKAFAEKTFLADNSLDFITMASAFHWTNKSKALKEFHRILKPGGRFIALWNPRDLLASPLQQEIDQWIKQHVKKISRKSSGAESYTKSLPEVLAKGGYFSNTLFFEGKHEEKMTKERYLEAWKSVNDIQAQAGEKLFSEILSYIEDKVAALDEIIVPYKTRAYVSTSTKKQL